MWNKFLVISVFLLMSNPVMAAFPPKAENPLSIGENTDLYVMNGRLGSRHFFAFDLGKGRADIGALGFNQSYLVPGEKQHQRSVDLDVSLNKYALYDKRAKLKLSGKELELGFTYSCASGTDKSGLVLRHCVISPMDFPGSLRDREKLAAATAPFLYHTFEVTNPTERELSAEVVFALDWLGKKVETGDSAALTIEMFECFTNSLNFSRPDHVLSTADTDAWPVSGKRNGMVFNFSVPAGKSVTKTVVQASYTDAPVMKHVDRKTKSRFYYTGLFDGVMDVVSYALDNRERLLKMTAQTESMLTSPEVDPRRQWLMALTFHTYLCNTWLVEDEAGRVSYYVWEGDYTMLSTIDVAHETAAVMGWLMPWTLELQLKEWADNTGSTDFGDYIKHDLGRDQKAGYAFYERTIASLVGLPPMPVEENANFALLLFWYDHQTGDKSNVKELLPVMERMLLATFARDNDGNGIADHDVGTTYDASDAIHTSPDNVYLGIKQMSAYLVGADLLERYGMEGNTERLRGEARKIAFSLEEAHSDYGYLPVSLDTSFPGWDQRAVVLGDGLLYPALTGFSSPEIEKVAGMLTSDFDRSVEACRVSYGTLMTDGEGTIFYSKVLLMEPIAAYLYEKDGQFWQGPYQWNLNNDEAYNDGAYSPRKRWTGYNYPRGVISLWPLLPSP